ncbi:MAG: YqaJ viral recombinase family protein [Acidobacteriaceae bacterium]
MAVYEEKESYAASRSNGLGGTDCAAILGLSPWRTPIEIYEGKVNPGGVPELDRECLFWGSALEPIVRGRYAQRFGVEVTAPADLAHIFPQSRPWNDSTLVIGKEPWMLGAPDGWLKSSTMGLEVKCSSRRGHEWGEEDSDEIPAHYLIQVAWYMAVCDAKGWDLAVLFSGNTLERFHVHRDPVLEKDMVEVARAFWYDNVLKQVEPPIDQTESYGRYLARKFSLSTGQVITNPSQEILDYTADMLAASQEKKAAEGKEREANNHLRALVGEAQKCITPMGTIGWVRPEETEVTDWAAVGKDLGSLHPDTVELHTKPKQGTAYLRAWWRK